MRTGKVAYVWQHPHPSHAEPDFCTAAIIHELLAEMERHGNLDEAEQLRYLLDKSRDVMIQDDCYSIDGAPELVEEIDGLVGRPNKMDRQHKPQ